MKPSKMFFLIIICLFTSMVNSQIAEASNALKFNSQSLTTIEAIKKTIILEAQKQGVAPSLVLSIAQVESDFQPYVVSRAGAIGVMQIMPATAMNMYNVEQYQLFDPSINIRLGVHFIKHLLNAYNGRVDIALSHYNGGSRVKNAAGKLAVIPATEKYVHKVLATQQHFIAEDTNNSILDSAQPAYSVVNSAAISSISNDAKQQINRLQELRLHNLTRSLQRNIVGSKVSQKSEIDTKKRITLVADNGSSELVALSVVERQAMAKINKVAKWEAIF